MLQGALIGFGKIAQQGHLPAYLNSAISSKAGIVAVAEPNSEYRSRAETFLPGVRLYESIDQLLENERLDFVDICTPPSKHIDAIEKCAPREIHILCEKPFAISLPEAARARGLLLGRKTIFMSCHQYRYSPIWKAFKQSIVNWNGSSKSLLQFNVYRTGADPGFLATEPLWRTNQRVSGGGILADTGIHYIYLALWMLGRPISIYATTGNIGYRDLEVEDTAVVSIVSEKGLAEITLTWGADRRANNARLSNREGSLVYDGVRLERFSSKGNEILPVPDASDKSTYISLYICLLQEFLNRIENKDSSFEWIDEAYHSIEILQACYKSANTGQAIILIPQSPVVPEFTKILNIDGLA